VEPASADAIEVGELFGYGAASGLGGDGFGSSWGEMVQEEEEDVGVAVPGLEELGFEGLQWASDLCFAGKGRPGGLRYVVTAPSEADWTSLPYLAITPRV